MRGAALTATSFVLTAAVVGHAYYQKKQFYPSVVYITKSNPSMARQTKWSDEEIMALATFVKDNHCRLFGSAGGHAVEAQKRKAWEEAAAKVQAVSGRDRGGWEGVRKKWNDASYRAKSYRRKKLGATVTGGGPQSPYSATMEAVLDALPDIIKEGIVNPEEGESIPQSSAQVVRSQVLSQVVRSQVPESKFEGPAEPDMNMVTDTESVLYIQAFVFVILMGKLVKKVFFGQLRASEMEHLIERSWYAVTETCLAFTVFRDDFSPKFVAMFTLLLFLKCFHWLAEDRVDYMERSPVIRVLFHLRVLSLLIFLGSLDAAWVNFAYHSTLTKGATVQLVFGFEYAILFTIICSVFLKYVLHTIDLQSENPWENKAVYMLYTDLIMGSIKVFLYTAFVAIMIKIHTFPLFAIRPMYLTMRAFKKAVNDIIMSRRAIRNMNTLYPDATPEELATMDNVCIICREDMNTACKKLPCNHIFHTSCLRSWFQRQQTCPTCRMDVLRASVRQPQPPPQQPQQQQPNNIPQPGQGMPPFPGYHPPFWMPPFQPGVAAFHPGGPQPGPQDPAAPSGPSQQQQQETPAGSSSAPNSTTGPSTQAPSAPPAAMPGIPPMPPFMMPPPFPMMPPFGIPPPVPPTNFSGLSEEELRNMEGHERQNLEARIECLRSIQTFLDAAVVQMQQYSTIVNRIGVPIPPNGPSTEAPNTPPPSPAAGGVSDESGNTTDNPIPAEGPVNNQLTKAKDSSVDLVGLEGASGFTPPTEGELIPEYDGDSVEEEDREGIRRRRLQRLQSS